MIKFLDLKYFIRGLTPVTTTDYFTRTGDFHDDGLFSEKIFGAESTAERRTTMSYIELSTEVIHPSIYRILMQLDRKIEKFISTEESFSLDSDKKLVIDPNGVTGMNEFIKLFPKIKFRGDSPAREKFIDLVNKSFKEESLFVKYIPVVPPDYRTAYQDEKNQWVIDKLNDYYASILRRSFQVKASGSGALRDLLTYSLQLSVIEHDNYIRTRLQKKQGIIRQQMLGKRVDFSGRAVITPDPKLKVDEIGLPMRLAVSLFEPFIIHQLLYSGRTKKEDLEPAVKGFTGLELSIDSINKVFKAIKAGDKVPEVLYQIMFDAVNRAIAGRYVLAKRDPVLHTESYRGYEPILTREDTVQICTLQVGKHNADFDGDTMGIMHPLSNEAQAEIKEKMMRPTTGSSSTDISFELSKEMWAGLYTITKDKISKSSPIEVTTDELDTIKDPFRRVKYRGVITSAGKAIFNSCFPIDIPFVQEQSTKGLVNKQLFPLVMKKHGGDVLKEVASRLAKVGFKWATIMSPTITLTDFELPKSVKDLKVKLSKTQDIEEAQKIIDEATILLKNHLKDTGFSDLIESGAGKGWDQPRQILFAKGIIADPQGNILDPVKGSFSDGLSNTEFFNAASGARKGIMDRVLNTADTGYMSRKLAYLMNGVEIDKMLIDCKTKRTLNLKLDKELMSRLTGRNIIKNGKVVEFDHNDFKVGDSIKLRSPVFCESSKLCHTCYGRLAYRHKTPYVGILAAQIIGEKGTQLIMKTFHTGGAVTIIKKDMVSDIVNNDPLVSKDVVDLNLKQQENLLFAFEDCTLTISLNDYKMNDNIIINEEDGKVWVKSLVCKAEFPNSIFNIILDYPVDLNMISMENIKKQSLIFTFKKGEPILTAALEAAELKGQVLYVERLIGGREIVKDASHLFRKLFRVYTVQAKSTMDCVHLEVLVSQSLRDTEKPRYPARLGKTWNPTLVNIKSTIFSEGFVQALAFENINKAINEGLISEEREEESILEKVMTGNIVEETKKR